MSARPKLEHAKLPLHAIRDKAHANLAAAIDAAAPHTPPHQQQEHPSSASAHDAHQKCNLNLVLDPALSGPLGLVAEVRELRARGVAKIFHLAPGPFAPQGPVLYILRPEIRLAQIVAEQIASLTERATLFFMPRRSLACEAVFKERRVDHLVTIGELPIHLIPLDSDLLSLEWPCFRELCVQGEHSVLHSVAASLAQLQATCGQIRTIRGKGSASHQVLRLLAQMRPPDGWPSVATASEAGVGAVGTLLLLDREVDLVTPMLTELTYEGLIHASFGISHGYVDLDAELVGPGDGAAATPPPRQPPRTLKRELNSNDPLYKQIRDANFGDVGPMLGELAKDVSKGYEQRHAAKTIGELREFMKTLGALQHTHKSLQMHIALAERIQKRTSSAHFHRRIEIEQEALASGAISADAEAALDDLIGRPETTLASALRLACLLSLVANGWRERSLKALHVELLHEYGYDRVALTLTALQRAGMLKRNDGRSAWPSLQRTLRLVADDLDEVPLGEDPPDATYFYSGYAPLSIRLVEWMVAASPTWASRVDALRSLPGPVISVEPSQSDGSDHEMAGVPPVPTVRATAAAASVTLVYFVGGCTYSEVSALRWLGRKTGRTFVIATTHMCSGESLIESVLCQLENKLEDQEMGSS